MLMPVNFKEFENDKYFSEEERLLLIQTSRNISRE